MEIPFPRAVPCQARPCKMWRQSLLRWLVVIAALVSFGFGSFMTACRAEDAEVTSRRSAERLSFSDSEIAEGFFAVAFGAELQFGKREERIRKFDGPVRVFVDNHMVPARTAEIGAAIADIGTHVPHLDIAVTEDLNAANVIVRLVRERDFRRTLSARFGAKKAKTISHALKPVCLSGFGKDETFRIRRAEVFLAGDVDDFTFADCVYEELLQALGPINDTAVVPWTMFNDSVQMGFFDRYDQYLLNILYDPRIAPGMTKEEVKELLPAVLPEVRERVFSLSALTAVSSPR